jgi:phytoene synthase
MAEEAFFVACAEMVRRTDPDRYFSALFAPATVRPLLFALYAFNYEVARVADSVQEPMLGEIRLQWWRETLEGARSGTPRLQDTARALAALFAKTGLAPDLFEALIDARAFDFRPETFADIAALESYVDSTSGNVMRLAARILGAGEAADGVIREAGLAYGLTGLLHAIPFHAHRNKVYVPMDLLAGAGVTADDVLAGRGAKLTGVVMKLTARAFDHLTAARRMRSPKAALPALLPASLVAPRLKRLARAKFDPFLLAGDLTIHRRQMALLSASLRGKI